jgi:hypothetical protein
MGADKVIRAQMAAATVAVLGQQLIVGLVRTLGRDTD